MVQNRCHLEGQSLCYPAHITLLTGGVSGEVTCATCLACVGQCPFLGPHVPPVKWTGHFLKRTFVNFVTTWLPSSFLLGMELCPVGGWRQPQAPSHKFSPLPYPRGPDLAFFPCTLHSKGVLKDRSSPGLTPDEATAMALQPSCPFCRLPKILPINLLVKSAGVISVAGNQRCLAGGGHISWKSFGCGP